MAFKIGFNTADGCEKKVPEIGSHVSETQVAPRKSVVRVYFAARNMTLAYYNDQFDLHCGDLVYVDGKLAGLRGRVIEVNYNFKIKIADYKRVICMVDTTVHGRFFIAGSHFVTFDRETLPRSKVLTWYNILVTADDEIICGSDDTAFPLSDLSHMNVSSEKGALGGELYRSNGVKYISVDGNKGYAIVAGSKHYEVEFEYDNGEIRNLTCSCFCSGCCKHEVAAMLQLRETLELIEKYYANEWENSNSFAAVCKSDLFAYAIDGKETGTVVL